MLHLATVSKANLYLCRMMLQDGEWKSIWQMVTVSSMTVLNLSGNGRHFHDLSLLEFQLKMQIWNINYECSPINKSLGILSAALYVKKSWRFYIYFNLQNFLVGYLIVCVAVALISCCLECCMNYSGATIERNVSLHHAYSFVCFFLHWVPTWSLCFVFLVLIFIKCTMCQI